MSLTSKQSGGVLGVQWRQDSVEAFRRLEAIRHQSMHARGWDLWARGAPWEAAKAGQKLAFVPAAPFHSPCFVQSVQAGHT